MTTYNGNTILENVEVNQSITVTDGSLTIQGNVGSGARITLESSQSNRTNQMNFGGSVVIIGNVNIGSAGHKLIVQGNVHGRANITGSSDMEFRGYLSDHVKVKTERGNITVKGNVGSNTTLKSMSGNVSVLSRDPSATIKTMSGKCYINGRSDDRRQNRSTNVIIGDMNISSGSSLPFNMSNLSNFFSGATTSIVNNRVFTNRGVEQAVPTPTSRESAAPTTSQMRRTTNGNTSHSSNDDDDMPVVLQSYIDDFKGESFQDAFKRLAVDVNNKYSYLSIFCIISQDIPNIPVSLNGRLYDWDSLKSQIETNGYQDPMTREMFTLKQVIPDRTTRDSLEGILKKEEEIHKSNIAACSSRAFKR